MSGMMSKLGRALGGATRWAAARSPFSKSTRPDPALGSAWAAWARGDFATAEHDAKRLISRSETADAGHFMLTLVSHIVGRHRSAIEHFGRISETYPWRAQLEEPVVWSYAHLHDYCGARAFATGRRIETQGATRERLALAVERPFSIEIAGLVEIPFVDDALTPYMPGFAARLNGQQTVARLDTGGQFVHVSEEQARAFGVSTVGCDVEFAALTTGKTCYGVADVQLGTITLRNVPVCVHHDTLPARAIADAFGVELGPIIGTNVLEQFLSTIDAARGRMILSRRGDAGARAEHHERIAPGEPVPFGLLNSHMMIATGQVGDATVPLFVDSGLVAVSDGAQMAFLLPERTMKAWSPGSMSSPAPIRDRVSIGRASRSGCTAFSIPDAEWRNFGDWSGIDVAGLISWGFLRHFTWTLDFDAYTFSLTGDSTSTDHPPHPAEEGQLVAH